MSYHIYIGINPYHYEMQKVQMANLGEPLCGLAAASNDTYAIFFNGSTRSISNPTRYGRDMAWAYDSSLTLHSPIYTSDNVSNLGATTVGDYIIKAGGEYSFKYSEGGTVSNAFAFDKSLTRSTISPLRTSCGELAATSIGNYALFGGGASGRFPINYVNAYSDSLVKTDPSNLINNAYGLAAASNGEYCMFGGGGGGGSSVSTSTPLSTVNVYDKSLTRLSNNYILSTSVKDLAATSINGYILFGGGYNGGASDYVTVFDQSLTKINVSTLSIARHSLAAASNGKYCMFGGGINGSDVVNNVDIYDKELTRTTSLGLSVSAGYLAATNMDKYILFAGGAPVNSSTAVGNANAYNLSVIVDDSISISKKIL